MRNAGWIPILVVVLVTLGCASTQEVRLQPEGTAVSAGGSAASYAEYSIPRGTGQVEVQVASTGISRAEGAPGQLTQVVFEIRVVNRSDSDAAVPASGFRVRDNDGNVSGPPILTADDVPLTSPVVVAPGLDATFALAFDMAGMDAPARLEALHLDWRIGDGAEAAERTTDFARTRNLHAYRASPLPPYTGPTSEFVEHDYTFWKDPFYSNDSRWGNDPTRP